MKLIRLKITQKEGYRSLPSGFEIHFLNDYDYDSASEFNPYIFAGVNGSGKSNILEALSEIFYLLDCIYLNNKPDYFSIDDEDNLKNNKFKPTQSRISSYELEYFTLLDPETFPNLSHSKKAQIFIQKKENERPVIEWVNKDEFEYKEKLTRFQTKKLLPEYVVAYSSGSNESLSLPYFKSRFIQYDSYFNELKNKEFVSPSPETAMIYLDESYSQAILLTNLLMWDQEGDQKKQKVLEPFKEYVKIKDIDSFRLTIRTDIEKDIEAYFSEGYVEDGYAESNKVRLLQNLDLKDEFSDSKTFTKSYLEKLKKCATSWNEELNYDTYHPLDDKEEFHDQSSYLVLDFKVNQATKEAFQFHFEYKPLELFEILQLFLILDIHSVGEKSKLQTYSTSDIFLNESIGFRPTEDKRILNITDFKIKKEGVSKSIYTRALSDGEHQFLHSLGLCLLFKDTRSLFLLDEPETHFNPDWKAKFISSLRSSFEKEEADSEKTMRDMLITSHSPYLISDSQRNNVFIINKDDETQKVLNPDHPKFQTFGSSINRIAVRIFKMPNTIGEFAQKRLKQIEDEFYLLKTKDDMEKLIDKLNEEMGDSVEKLILLNKIIDKIESL